MGTIVVVVAVDIGLGAAWAAIDPPESELPAAVDAIRLRAPATAGDLEPVDLDDPNLEPLPPDPRASTPAMRDLPWAEDYFDELRRAPSTYWPYLLWRPAPAAGRYLNIRDFTRVSVAPPDRGPRPLVDFYGGSTMYGEGQRDAHTIPSAVAALAAADGLPIEPVNRGVQGWVNWQEMLLFEQVVADGEQRPDIALFYDGANERYVQSFGIRGVPAHSDLDAAAERMAGDRALSTSRSSVSAIRALTGDYADASALVRLVRGARSAVVGTAAEAAPMATAAPARARQADADWRAVPGIYRRGRELIREVAVREGVEVVFVWQPIIDGGWDTYAEGIDQPTIDLSQLLRDRDDVFIDAVHTNEDGAQIVAAALWELLRPTVAAWHEEHRGEAGN